MNKVNRIVNKFKYAIKGLHIAFKSENSFKVHFTAAFFVILTGILLHFTKIEWIFILLAISIVLISELFNTAIEFLVKMFTSEYDALAEKLLNISAGAVLLSVFLAIILAVMIYFPYIKSLVIGN